MTDSATEGTPEVETPASTFSEGDLALVVEILNRAKITMWAASGADEDYAIRLWSPGAEAVYKYSPEEAIGANYLDLFVNPNERDRAIEDHARMVANDETYEWDWAADDIGKDGLHTMLTNCFPILDPRTGRPLLAEVGVDLSKQEQATAKHKEVLSEAVKEIKAGNVRWMGAVTSLYAGAARPFEGPSGREKTVQRAASVVRTVAGYNPIVRIYVKSEHGFELASGSDEERKSALAFDEQQALTLLAHADSPDAIFVDPSSESDAGISMRRSLGRFRSAAVIPIMLGFELRGMVAIHFRDRPRISDDKRGSLEHLGMHIGVVLAMEDQRAELERSRALEVKSIEVQAVQRFLRLVFHRVGGSAYVLGEDLRSLIRSLEDVELPESVRTKMTRLLDRSTQIEAALEDFRKERDHVHEIRAVDIRPLFLAKKQEVELAFPTVEVLVEISPTLVRTSEFLIAEALGNLLNNAAEELIDADGGGDIRVRVSRHGEDVHIDVEDTGRGIAAEKRETIWARGETTKGRGHGYGLPFARDATELANGRIVLQERNSDLGGAHFTLILPAG